MKKAYALHKLCGDNYAANTSQEMILELIIFFAYMAYTIFSQHGDGRYPDYIILFLGLRLADSATSIRGPQTRVLPVTDRYLLCSYLFFWPTVTLGLCGLAAAGLVLCDPITGNENNYFWYALRYVLTDVEVWWTGLIFAFGFLLLCKAGQFSMDHRKRIAGIIIEGAVYFIIAFAYGKIAADKWVCLGLACLWLLLTALIAYVRGMRFLRYDVKSQKTYDLEKEADAWGKTKDSAARKSGDSSTFWIVVTVVAAMLVICVVAIFSSLDIFGLEKTDVSYISTEASQYSEWNAIPELVNFEDFTFDGVDYQSVFPDAINASQAEAYYSSVTGEVGEYYSSLTAIRYLKISYTAGQYAAEKQRVSGLTVTADEEYYKDDSFYGTTQEMICDTEHFPYETYIAVWEPDAEFEYVMFDDADHTVYYVYTECAELEEIPAKDTLFDGDVTQVIPEDKQNDGSGCYSIYTFGSGIVKSLVQP